MRRYQMAPNSILQRAFGFREFENPDPGTMLVGDFNGDGFLYIREEQIIMFETAVQEKRTGMLWGLLMGVVALAVLLGTGYALIT